MLAYRQKISQNLRRVRLVRQPVIYRDARIFRQLLDDLLAEAAVLDRVKHSAEHARRVLQALLLPYLRARRVEIDCRHSEVGCRHLERAARPRARLLEYQRDVLAGAQLVRDAALFFIFQPHREGEQRLYRFGRQIHQF